MITEGLDLARDDQPIYGNLAPPWAHAHGVEDGLSATSQWATPGADDGPGTSAPLPRRKSRLPPQPQPRIRHPRLPPEERTPGVRSPADGGRPGVRIHPTPSGPRPPPTSPGYAVPQARGVPTSPRVWELHGTTRGVL